MAINELDAREVFDRFETLDTDTKPRAAKMLADYRTQQEAAGAPVWPTEAKRLNEQRQQMRAVFDDPRKLDESNGLFGQISDPATADKLRAKEASTLFLADRYGKPVEEVRGDFARYSLDYSSQQWGEKKIMEPAAFFAKAKAEVTKEKAKNELHGELLESAYSSALEGVNDGFVPWLETIKSKPGYDPHEEYTYRQTWQAVEARVNKEMGANRGMINNAVDSLMQSMGVTDTADGRAAEWNRPVRALARLAMEDPQAYKHAKAKIADIALRAPKDEKAGILGWLQKAGESPARGTEKLTEGSLESAQIASARLAEIFGKKSEAEYMRAEVKVSRDLRDIANGIIDPIERKDWLDTMVFGGLESAPTMAAAVTPAGRALLVGSYASDAHADFERNGWGGAGAESAALGVGVVSSVVESASEFLGKIPGVSSALASIGARPGSKWLTRAVLQMVERYPTEIAEEALQDMAAPAVQSVLSAFDVVAARDKGFSAEWEQWKKETLPDVALIALPLAVLGAGIAGAQEIGQAKVKALTQDRETLTKLFGERDAERITSIADDGERLAAVQTTFQGQSAEARLAHLKMQEVRKDAAAEFQRAVDSGIIGRIQKDLGRDAEGWSVTIPETGEVVRVSNREEAVSMVFGHLDEQEQRRAQAGAQMWDEIYEAGGMGAESLRAEAGNMDTKKQAARSPEDAARVARGIETYAQLHGIPLDEAKNIIFAVNGYNKDEMLENVRTAVSNVFGRGMNVGTVLHEATHGRWRAALEAGRFTHGQGVAWVRLAEQATGIDFLPSKVDAEISADVLDEAIVDVTVSDAIGRRKDGGRFSAGLISRGMAALARGERAEAKQAGTFATWLKAWRDFWGVVIQKGKALHKAKSEGKLGDDYEHFLDELMSTSPQARHEAAAASDAMEIAQAGNMPFSLGPAYGIEHRPRDDLSEFGYFGEKVEAKDTGTSFSLAPRSLPEVVNEIEAAGVEMFASEKGGIIRLSKIIVPKDERNKGLGTQAMRALIAYADATNQQIALTPSADFGGSKARLEKFYRGLGFRTYKGYAVQEKLIRDPAGASFSLAPRSLPEVERITPENKVAPSINGKPAADIFAEVKKRHGVTRSIYEAGYILPDGTMLDFSGRADAGDFKQGPDLVFRISGRDWMKDQRGVDHREIEWQDMPDYKETWEPMVAFLRLGAVRVDANSGMISMHSRAKITASQASALKSIVVAADGAYIDLEDDARNRSSMQLSGGKWGKVNGLLTRWANGESPEFEGASFSLAPRSLPEVADTILGAQMRRPEFREAFLELARQKLAKLRADGDWRVDKRGIASKRIGFDSRMAGVRSPANIEAERKFRLRSRQRELIDAGMIALPPEVLAAYDSGVASLEDVPMVKDMLSNVGKIMPKSTAQKTGKLKTDGVGSAGDYDGAPRLPPSWYAKSGGIMPYEIAQQLSDLGHLQDGYADTLWEALRSAIYSTKTANEGFQKAREAIRKVETDALAQAKTEADAWAKEERAKVPTPKERQMMALRTLDAILSAYPPEIRGMVGGFVKLASLGTDKAREAEIIRRLDLLDEVVEKMAKKHYGERIEKILDKAAPKRDAGKKPTGKLGAQIQTLFDLAETFSELDAAGVSAERAAIADRMEKETNPAKLADLLEREQMLDLFGAVYERTSAEMESAAKWLNEAYSQGRNVWRAVIEARQEEVKAGRATAKADSGKEGTDAETQAALEQAKDIGSKLKSFSLSFLSFEQVMTSTLGRTSALAKSFVNLARKATNQKTDALRDKRKAFRAEMAAIFGTSKQTVWQQRLYELSQISDKSAMTITKMEGANIETVEVPADIIERILNGKAEAKAYKLDTLTLEALADAWADNEALPGNRRKKNLSYEVTTAGKPTPTKLSQLQAVHLSMMARQASYTENMAGHGWDAYALQEIEVNLTPEAKAIRDFLATEYRAGYDSLNAVYSRMYGLNLPRLTNYAPGTFEAMDAMGQDIDPYGQGLLSEGGFKAEMLKMRKKHNAKPRPDDALSVYWGHVNATEHFKAFGEFARDIRDVMNHADVRASVTAKGGRPLLETMQSWITAFERNGLEQGRGIAAFNELARKRQSAQSWVALAYNVSTLLKQSTAALGSVMSMGPADAARQLAKLFTGQLDLGASYRSGVIQRRLDAGYSPEVRQAMAGAMAEKPTWGTLIVQRGMETIGMVDAMFTTASHAMAYDYHLSQAKAARLNDTQAQMQAEREAEATVARTAQPVEMMDRSLIEVGMSPLAKFLFMFASDARQKAALAWEAYSPSSDLTKGERATRLLMLHVMLPVMVQTITNLWRDARDDGEDDEFFDERNWQAGDYVRAMMIGPLIGIPLVSQALNSFSSQSPLTQLTGGVSDIGEAFDEGDIDKAMKAVKTVLRTAAVVAGGERAAAVAVGAGALFDAYRVVGNLTSDE